MQQLDAETLRYIYRVALIFALVASAAVVVTYHLLSDGAWKESPLGRNLFGSDTTLCIMLVWSIFASFVSDSARSIVFMVGIVLFIAYIYFRIDRAMLMWRSEKKRRRDRQEQQQ